MASKAAIFGIVWVALHSASLRSGPTPGARNSVHAAGAPPQMRHVRHLPEQPTSGTPVLVTVKVTDADGVASVTLHYQCVDPGAYVELTDPEYGSRWTSLEMNDAGAGGDQAAGDSVHSVRLPASLQVHRRLVRYRITAVDGAGNAVTAPFPEDPQPNFAYFVYDGVPPWRGAIEPGSADPERGRVVEYPAGLMNRLPVYHLITKKSSAEDATWNSRDSGSSYRWRGSMGFLSRRANSRTRKGRPPSGP